MIAWITRLLPTGWLWAVLGAGALAISGYIVALHIEIAHLESQAAQAQASFSARIIAAHQATIEAQDKQAALLLELTEANGAIDDIYHTQQSLLQAERKARDAADAARRQSDDSLRNAIRDFAARRPAGDPAPGAPGSTDDRATVLAGLSIESIGLLQEAADVLRDGDDAIEDARLQLNGLTDYARNVCRPVTKLGAAR